jgi:Tfp pilus assembly protein PilX
MNARDRATKGDPTMTTSHSGPGRPGDRPGQEGMALVLAIMVLLVLTVIGAALMANVNTETKIAGLKVRDTQALSIAEAGVQEAMLRIKNGDVPDNLNPRNVTMIFNQVAGSIPAVGADTTALPTLQTAGSYLNYSTAGKNALTTLSMHYKTKAGAILRYDDTANPKINTSTGNPIWVVQSTGTEGGSSRTVYAEVCRSKFNVLAKGAVVANVAISFKGNISVCGHDHRADTPAQVGPGACDASWHAANPHTTCMPGAWSTNAVGQQGSPYVSGSPAAPQTYQTGFYSGPWDCLTMTQTDFWAWVGARVSSEPSPPVGIYYLDNDNTKQNASGNFSYNGGDGEGFLYVDGDLRLNGNFTYRGMIYCEGDLSINGNCWILGGIVVKGKTTVKIANGSAIILYSADSIQQKLSKYGGNLRTIAWREL